MVTRKLQVKLTPVLVHGSPILLILRFDTGVGTGGGGGFLRQAGSTMSPTAEAVSSAGLLLAGLPGAGTAIWAVLGRLQAVAGNCSVVTTTSSLIVTD